MLERGEAMTIPATTRIDLLVLSLLSDRPMHGYELYQQIQAEDIDAWFNISMAGIYYSLGKLRDQGLVAESRQRGGRSARKSIHHLTEEGRAAFFAAMEMQATSHDRTYLDYDLVVYLLNRLPVQRAVALLQQRQAFLASEVQRLQVTLDAEQEQGSSPLKLAILEHQRRFLHMEQGWLADVIRDVQGSPGAALDLPGPHGKLMLLSGDLRHYHLLDLIQLITSGMHNGTLTVTDGLVIRTLSFEAGRPVCAACIRQDQPSAPPQAPEQVLEGLYDLFRWQEGQFTFDQDVSCEEWCVPLKLSAEELILGGCRWVDNWTIIQRLVPSADAIFERGRDPHNLNGLSLTERERQVLSAVDGIQEVSLIARQLGLTLFEASRAFYCLAAVGVVRSADLDKIRLRRVFRETAELVCNSTTTWRTSPDDLSCEELVNERTQHLPLRLNHGRIEDQADPHLKADKLMELYGEFLRAQLEVVSQNFGRENARHSLQRTLHQLAPELHEVALRYDFDKLLAP
jgi:DNA-binding PadR family transcriptional regulator